MSRIIDEAVLGAVSAAIFTEEFTAELTAEVTAVLAAAARRPKGTTVKLHREIAKRQRQIARVNRNLEGLEGDAAPADTPLFDVPTGLVRILDRDLAAAGIPKRDDRGRTVDVHALRHTFATHLVAAGVAPRTAQTALRHSSLELTMQLYTDPRLFDVAGSLAALPTAEAPPEAARATGTDDAGAVALNVALNTDRTRRGGAFSAPSPRNATRHRTDEKVRGNAGFSTKGK